MSTLTANAVEILGTSCDQFALRRMFKALSLHSWLNDADERLRLIAARQALANWSEFCSACRAKRDARLNPRLVSVNAYMRQNAKAILDGKRASMFTIVEA